MRFNRRGSDRPNAARFRPGASLETLETRELLTSSSLANPLLSVYVPHDLQVTNPITNQPTSYSVDSELAHNAGPNSPLLGNSGKILSGKDRQGDEWTITVHGPGYAVVTDTSPNDGSLDDNLDTIQLVGTSLTSTYVTGNVVASFRTQTASTGTVAFNQLIATAGVKSIILNGFSLEQTVAPAAGTPNNLNTYVHLLGGVGVLSFNDIDATVDTSNADAPINIVIGDPSIPLKVAPVIKLQSINNTAYDSTLTTPPALVPQTTPTVDIEVNGKIKSISLTSATADLNDLLSSPTIDSNAATIPHGNTALSPFISTTNNITPGQVAAYSYQYPTVATTGRTAINATAVGSITVAGAATNLTASRTNPAFENGFSGLSSLGSATFNGPTDAVGLDVNGPVGTVTFNKGISNTTGLYTGTTASGSQVPASQYGQPAATTSYAGAGYIGAQVTATSIKKVTIKTATVTTQSPSNPDFVGINGAGTIYTKTQPGVAAANALIVSSGSIGKVTTVGTLVNSEIKSGFDYTSYAAGLEGTRAASTIGPVSAKSNLTSSVISATYRPSLNTYGTPNDVAGPGKVTGTVTGQVNTTGGATTLGNVGSGVYAKVKVGKLPSA